MKAGYLDTSALVCIAFAEAGWEGAAAAFDGLDVVLSSNLLEAELRSALVREQVEVDTVPWLDRVQWVFPTRGLGNEFKRVLRAGYVRGADLWHLACALYVSPDPASLWFMTLDERQRSVAEKVGFQTSW